MIYRFGEQLIPVTMEEWEDDQVPAVFLTDSRHADATLAKAGIIMKTRSRWQRSGSAGLKTNRTV